MTLGRTFEVLSNRFLALRPSAVCVGAQKSGTTALYQYLKLHPQIVMPRVKELDIFNCDSRYEQGLRTYLENFPRRSLRTVGNITLDVTPGYLGGAERAAARIASFRSSMRIIVLLRDPVTRAYSAWQMYRRFFRSNPNWFLDWIRQCNLSQAANYFRARSPNFGDDFVNDIREEIEAIKTRSPIEMPILKLGDYAKLLTYYFQHFDSRKVLILWSEDFSRETLLALRRIESFLGLKPHRWGDNQLKPHFTGDYENDPIPAGAQELLVDYYAPRNEALFRLIGTRTQWLGSERP